ncbi:hypothetical protein EJ08DRAFT_598111 [Tothia fuscella]|uniref:Kelch repeat-containing protein n=1 Tax=Tothia fuscella TaxID=1048955 RepID=A0A9P4NGL8_9PEZI|nr:hypothetical protein EJ08DRAFT_598111 [Tothia fuscella]
MFLVRRLSLVACLLAIAIPITHFSSLGTSSRPILGATGVPVPEPQSPVFDDQVLKRATSPTDYCKRWSQQSALVNGTMYLYGGRKSTSSSQTDNTWNNDFLTLDLTKTWQISSPAMSGLPQPSGPPPVSNGYLWSSYDALYLYGGEYSDKPQGTPDAFSLWEYDIKGSKWKEHKDPKTSAGKNSEAAGQSIQRAAEGAGFSLPALGRGWYFGGHLDFLTTQSWSIQTPRLYLKSFVEYTFPGMNNKELSMQNAGSEGAWRNITRAGIQEQSGFTQRADGILVFVPGFGAEGILISLGGGTNETFTQMNEVDIFDIEGSTWYRQATSGKTPKIRVNPCAVVGAAPDGSSYNIYMFGGQNLIPWDNQIQYDDMWILSVPSFTWIEVEMDKSQSVPYPRAGHTCNVWDGQMVVVGGYIGKDISCETPGVYVFNMSSLSWQNRYTSLSSVEKSNPFSQQNSQKGVGVRDGIEGSLGYQVPQAVRAVVGGNGNGGATITAPVQTATSGPMASGKPITYTVTDSHGAVITEFSNTNNNPSSGGNNNKGAKTGAIVAGVVAGVLAIVVVYLAFCAYIYRKQLQIYKQHMAMVQERQEMAGGGGLFLPPGESSLDYSSGGGPGGSKNQGSNGQTSLIGPYHTRESHETTNLQQSSQGDQNSLHSGSDSSEGLMDGFEPSYYGVLLHPRRSLRIVNKD